MPPSTILQSCLLLCENLVQCAILLALNLKDNFTTNYLLPGGSTGQIVSGVFTAPDGSSADLINGNYSLADGSKGNIYGSAGSPSRPNTATLPIPTQYTASGSGSAIPATALGQEVTYTTTIPGTTIEPSTIPFQTTTVTSIVTGSTIISAVVEAPTTVPGKTVAPVTSTFVTKIAGPSATTNDGWSATRIRRGLSIVLTEMLLILVVLAWC